MPKAPSSIAKAQAGGDWLVGEGKKKAKWDAVNDIFDALEKPVKGFVDAPGALSNYGLDKPVAHVVLKQGAQVRVDCIFGKEAKDGVYVQVQGEPYVKIAEKEILDKLGKSEADYLEPPPPPPTPPATPEKINHKDLEDLKEYNFFALRSSWFLAGISAARISNPANLIFRFFSYKISVG